MADQTGNNKWLVFLLLGAVAAVIATLWILGSANYVPSANPELTGYAIRNLADLKDKQPYFTDILTTVYYTPNEADFGSWCSPAAGKCLSTREEIIAFYNTQKAKTCVNDARGGQCCINEAQRGAYEELKCQGSMVGKDGKIYKAETAAVTREQTRPVSTTNKNGITSQGTDPTPHRTVAVNAKRGSECYIPYGQYLYIYFGEGNPWNGFYIAEDTGSAFAGNCKIDVYAGVGKAALEDARKWISGKHPKVYLLDKNFEYIPPDKTPFGTESGASSSYSGTFTTTYGFALDVDEYGTLYEKSYAYAQRLVSSCALSADKDACISNYLLNNQDADMTVLSGSDCSEYAKPEKKIGELEDAEQQFTDIEGTVSEIEHNSERFRLGYSVSTMTLKDDTGEMEIILAGDAPRKALDLKAGDSVLVRNVLLTKSGSRIINSDSNIVKNPDYLRLDYLESFAMQIGDCEASQSNACACSAAYSGPDADITYGSGTLSFKDADSHESVDVSYELYARNTDDSEGISRSEHAAIGISARKGSLISFFKDADGKMILIEDASLIQDKDSCEIKTKQYNLCSSLAGTIAPYTDYARTGKALPYTYTYSFSVRI